MLAASCFLTIILLQYRLCLERWLSRYVQMTWLPWYIQLITNQDMPLKIKLIVHEAAYIWMACMWVIVWHVEWLNTVGFQYYLMCQTRLFAAFESLVWQLWDTLAHTVYLKWDGPPGLNLAKQWKRRSIKCLWMSSSTWYVILCSVKQLCAGSGSR